MISFLPPTCKQSLKFQSFYICFRLNKVASFWIIYVYVVCDDFRVFGAPFLEFAFMKRNILAMILSEVMQINQKTWTERDLNCRNMVISIHHTSYILYISKMSIVFSSTDFQSFPNLVSIAAATAAEYEITQNKAQWHFHLIWFWGWMSWQK